MKLRMEFEDDDLREMIDGYFRQSGFQVKNLDQLCDLFRKAFPEGIEVQVATLPVTVPAEPVEPVERRPRSPEKEFESSPEDEDEEYVDIDEGKGNGAAEGNPRMSASDLFDPTPGKVPTRDEQLKQTQDELKHLLNQSKVIEEEKAKEN